MILIKFQSWRLILTSRRFGRPKKLENYGNVKPEKKYRPVTNRSGSDLYPIETFIVFQDPLTPGTTETYTSYRR